MSMQLTLDFTRSQREQMSVIQNESWLDVSALAGGVGFTATVQVGINLNDALEPLQNEIDGDYDQRLYDALWLAHLNLSLAQSQSATLHFIFPRKDEQTEKVFEISFRLRVEAQKQVVILGMLEDW